MQLTNEDNLRLNVLLAQPLKAVRIDESKMIVYALTDKGEAKVQLNPNCKDEVYIKRVRELISTQILGSPKGYPVFLSRWTRMGQARDESLDRLLLLGEPEAVVALVHAPGVTAEHARHAWWAMPTSENARRMLEKQAVVEDELGSELAEFLIEFLPFEEDQKAMIDTVKLVLQPGLISDEVRQQLWQKAKSKTSYYVGFLTTTPHDLPETQPAHSAFEDYQQRLLAFSHNPVAELLLNVFSSEGQSFLHTTQAAFKRPNNQDVVVALVNNLAAYFDKIRPINQPSKQIDEVLQAVEAICDSCSESSKPLPQHVHELTTQHPELRPYIQAMLNLSCMAENVVMPVFATSDAIGSVMRKKLEPVTRPLLQQVQQLRS